MSTMTTEQIESDIHCLCDPWAQTHEKIDASKRLFAYAAHLREQAKGSQVDCRTAEDDQRDFGTGFTVDGVRVDPSRVRVYTAPSAAVPPCIATDDDVERIAKQAGWDNRRYMTPKDYAIWCDRMREFVRLSAAPHEPSQGGEGNCD